MPNVLKTTLSFLAVSLILFTASCSITNSKKYKNLLSEKEINDFAKNEIKTKGKFKWESVSNHLMYSALMHGDSILSISYKIAPNGSQLPVYGDSNKLPKEWIIKRDEIVQYILKKERAYRKQPNLTVYNLLPLWNEELEDRIPNVSLQVLNPSVIIHLRKDKMITGISPGYSPRLQFSPQN